MILLCPLIHPPIDAGVSDYTLMRSSLPFCESLYGWFHLVMRDTVKVIVGVCVYVCACIFHFWKSAVYVCVCMCAVGPVCLFCYVLGGHGAESVCFSFVQLLLQSAPLVLTACHTEYIYIYT